MNIGSARFACYVHSQRKQIVSFRMLFGLMIVALMLSGCTSIPSTSDFVPTMVDSGEDIATNTPVLPTPTVTFEPTITATTFVFIREGQALPDDLAVISAKNVNKLQEIGRWGNGVAYDIAWSADGTLIAISTSRYLLLIDVTSLEIIRRIDTGFPLYRISFSSDSSKIYGGGTQGKLLTYDIAEETQETINLGNTLPITAVAASQNGQYVAVADWQKSVHLWDLENNRLMTNFASTFSGSKALGFSSDNEILFGWSPIEPITGWHILTAKQPEEYYFGMDANQHTGSSVRISADGNAAAVNQTWQIRVQNMIDGTSIGVLKDFYYEVEDLDITADGEWTLSLHNDQVRLWQNNKSKLITSFDLADLMDQLPVSIRVSPDGRRFVLLGQDLVFFEIDMETQEITQTDIMPVNLVTDLSFAAQLTAEDVLYQVGLDGALYKTELQSGDVVQSAISSQNQISAYAVSESLFAGGYDNYTIELRDLQSMEVEKKMRGLSKIPAALLISEPQNVIIAQTDKSVTGIWEISTGNYIGKQEWDLALGDLQLSHDKRYILGSGDGFTQIYDLEEQSMTDELYGRLLAVSQNIIVMQRYGRDAALVFIDSVTFNTIQQRDSYSSDSAVFSADGKLLALSGKELVVVDMEQSEVVLQIENPARGAEFFFSSDGRVLFFVHADGSILLYGVAN